MRSAQSRVIPKASGASIQNPSLRSKMLPTSRSGGTRRCFYEFQTLVACYTSQDTLSKKECTPVFDDYFECLHGLKEREKARLMLQQLKANEASGEGLKSSDLFLSSGSSSYQNLNLVK